MEIIEHDVPPFELKFTLQEHWIEQVLVDFFPKSLSAGKTLLKLLIAPKITFAPDEIRINLSFEIEHPLSIGRITGQVNTEIGLSQLADLEEVRVKMKSLIWQKGPKFEMGNIFGFSIMSLAKSKIAALEKDIAPRIEKEIAQQFLKNTRDNPFYQPYLQQQLPEVNLNLATQVKKIFYRIDSQQELIELCLFPILDVQIKDEQITTEVEAGPTLPGVGGGFIQFYINLSQAFIQKEISQRLIGRSVSAGNRNVTIESINIILGNELIIAQVHFANNELPMVTAELTPILDSNKQIVNLNIENLSMEKASWLLKGIFSLLKRNIENKIEKNLQFDISEFIDQRQAQFNEVMESNLNQYDLRVQTFSPKTIITKIFTIKGKLIIQGQIGGTIEIVNKEAVV